MAYGFYNVTLILDDEQEKRLEKLEKQFKKINGWNKKDIMQFAIVALRSNVEISLEFVEIKVQQIKQEGIKEDDIIFPQRKV